MSYQRPEQLKDALNCLALGGFCIAAGCTDLFPATDNRQLLGKIVDITAIKALRGIVEDESNFKIGSATTWSDIIAADLPPAFHHLKQAAREVGSVQIQNAATLGGNLCNASPAADGVPALLVLDAQVELQSASDRRIMPLAEFINGPRQTALKSGELLTGIIIPKSSTAGRSLFLKLGARKYLVISIAMVAARLSVENGIIADAALAVGSCSAVATRLPDVEKSLVGKSIEDPTTQHVSDEFVQHHIDPISDARSDAAYRRIAARELITRAVAELLEAERLQAA